MSLLTSPFSRLASATVSGLVGVAAQTFAGVKTFASAIVAAAGIQLGTALYNSNGSGSTDVCVKEGTNVADGTVNAQAKIVSWRTGLNGTEVEYAYFAKQFGFVVDAKNGTNQYSFQVLNAGAGTTGFSQSVAAGGSATWGGAGGYSSLGLFTTNRTQFFIANGAAYNSEPNIFYFLNQADATKCVVRIAGTSQTGSFIECGPSGTPIVTVTAAGRVDISGTDSSGTPGAATINKPSGVSAIAAAATTCVITNSLVTATSRVHITPHGNLGTWWVVRAAGSFTLTLAAGAGANTAFSWEVSSII